MENELIKMFGENYKERMMQIRISEFVTDNETERVFENLCEVVFSCKLSDEQLVESLMLLPYNIAYVVMAKSKRDLSILLEIYKNKLYQEFVLGVDAINKKGVSDFELRYKRENIQSFEKFLKVRLLTRYEIEALYGCLSKYGNFEKLSYRERHEYNGNNRFMRHLSCAHKMLSEPGQSRVRFNIMHKIKNRLMEDAIFKIDFLSMEL